MIFVYLVYLEPRERAWWLQISHPRWGELTVLLQISQLYLRGPASKWPLKRKGLREEKEKYGSDGMQHPPPPEINFW